MKARTPYLLLSSLALAIFAVALACSNGNQNPQNVGPIYTPKSEQGQEMAQTDPGKGFRILENYCFSCHSPNASHEDRVAPPMVAIKKHYIDESTTEEQFTRDLLAFIKDPDEENTKMPNAVKRFGVMPKMGFSDQEIRDVAAYIFQTELEAPAWFEEHYQQERKKYLDSLEALSPIEKGKHFAMSTKSILGKNLMGAIKSKGTTDAVSFCNERAYPLTDSMALAMHASIKRVSDKNRNPQNAANAAELAYIAEGKKTLAGGGEIKPSMKEIDGKMVGYYPILTNQMCLQCHGQKNTDIKAETLGKISSLYPADKAIGYGENELRGIWVVQMDKE